MSFLEVPKGGQVGNKIMTEFGSLFPDVCLSQAHHASGKKSTHIRPNKGLTQGPFVGLSS